MSQPISRTLSLLIVAAVLLPLFACKRSDKATPEYEAEIATWRSDRIARLRSEDGWLSLIGLDWLNEGPSTIGSDPTNKIKLPAYAPPFCGTLVLTSGQVTLEPNPAADVRIGGKTTAPSVSLLDDTKQYGPTIVTIGSIQFQIINRNEKYGVRIKDPASEARTHFRGLQYFPANPRFRFEARFEPYNPPHKIRITNVLGMTSDETSPGSLVFMYDGKEYRVDPILEQGEKNYFLIFKDATSGHETYDAARYVYAAPPGPDGKTILDFNKAYNPPCAFTSFATCPLPPSQNRLPFRIEAGEKKYAGGHPPAAH